MGPPASFEASKLKVVPLEDLINKRANIIPRTYILSHCDFTANLTLTVSNVINLDQVGVLNLCLSDLQVASFLCLTEQNSELIHIL